MSALYGSSGVFNKSVLRQIVDQEVCFSPICLLLVRFDPLLSLLSGSGAAVAPPMQCNATLACICQ